MNEERVNTEKTLLPPSSFAGLLKFWPYLAKMGQLAEAQAVLRPEQCPATIQAMAQAIIGALRKVYLDNDSDKNASPINQLINLMNKQRPCPAEVYDSLHAMLKLTDKALPEYSAERSAALIMPCVYLVCQWLEAVFTNTPQLEPVYNLPSPPSTTFATPEEREQTYAQYFDRLHQQATRYSSNPPQAFLDPKLEPSQMRILGQKTRPYQPLTHEQKSFLAAIIFFIKIANEQSLFINYALCCNRISVISELVLANNSSQDLNNIKLTITSPQDVFSPYECSLNSLKANSSGVIRQPELNYNLDYLTSLTESTDAKIDITVCSETITIEKCTLNVRVYTYDQCHSWTYMPELTAAFVMPNHPEVTKIIADASQLLEKWTGNPSLTDYQSGDPNQVLQTAAAIYGALQQQNIIYATHPASFDGQRLRLPETIAQQKMGNCADLSLLFAASLEAVNLHPILIKIQQRMFVGVWLLEAIFAETVVSDPSQLTNRIAAGVDQIACVESVSFTAGQKTDFDTARNQATTHLYSIDDFEFIIDVKRARLSGIKPMPMRILTDAGWKVERPKLEQQAVTAAPQQILAPRLADISADETPASKKAQWERKLLDLSMRNTLLNLRWGGSVVPLFTSSIDTLEDYLADGEEFHIKARSSEMGIPSDGYNFENIQVVGNQFHDLLEAEFKNNRLYSTHSEGELRKNLTNLYRASQNSLEENGANTLFLALGMVRWYENERSNTPRFAPILLLPIDIIRKSAAQGYTIRLRDDEPQLNITMLEKFKQDFQLNIGGLDPLPLDEHGLDTRLIFTTVRYAIMGQPRWDVLESVCLGIFSFSQFVMWNDIRNRGDDLAQNKIVRSLMEGKLCWEAEDIAMPAHFDEGDTLLPIQVDGSQLRAIQAANEGCSFVLHGPPGTGKSQTITALIANALAQGKTVLFVAEKMAALQVVHKRLKAIGLGPFCLELHSNTAQKSAVLGQLESATNVVQEEEPATFAFKTRQLAGLRNELDSYGQALHRRYPCGLSLFDIINLYVALPAGTEIPWNAPQALTTLTQEQLSAYEPLVRRLILTAQEIGHPYQHPLAAMPYFQYSRQIEDELRSLLPRWQAQCLNTQKAFRSYATALEIEEPHLQSDYLRLLKTGDALIKWLEVPKEWLGQEHPNFYLGEVQKFARHHLHCRQLRQKLLERWNESFLKQDPDALLNELNETENKWVLARWSGSKSLLQKMQGWARGEITLQELRPQYQLLKELQQEETTIAQMHPLYAPGLGRLYLGEGTDWQAVAQEAQRVMELLNQNADDSQTRPLLERYGGRKELLPIIETARQTYAELRPLCQQGLELLGCSISEQDAWLTRQLFLINSLSKHIDELKAWSAWCKTSSEAEACGLAPLVAAYRQGLAHDQVMNAGKRSFYKNLALSAIESAPILDEFRGLLFNEQIEQFNRLDQELRQLSRQEIYSRLSEKIPNFTKEASKNSEIGILQKAIRSKGRGISLRKLFDRLPNLLHRICPCMLMSPLSVAQYIDPCHPPFDLVVFDEASQIQTCKAIGALARARDAVIVGDPKQMPPTNFFSTSSIDEENLELEDLESILEDCLALHMPQTHLLWHYRSRHESLIAFSNQQFYENKLFTFPSSNARESKVTLHHVEGIFERGKRRTNTIEGQAVIEELKRRAQDPILRKQSIGIVTFNIAQQNLIDDLFMEACQNDSALENWAYNAEEPLFIKKLEIVQCDERDVIIFSIGYGPDEFGRTTMNFGPLNRDGGWRRLNVAISRARREMMVFTSLWPEQINTARTRAAGVHALRAFLEFAHTQHLPPVEDISAIIRPQREEISRLICQELQKYGYSTDLNVGHSEYKIDVGVVDNRDPQRYLLGILLDGPAYEQAQTTRDREIGQKSVLQGLGWHLVRIWSLDWWENPQRELNRLLQQLQEAAQALEEQAKAEAELRAQAEAEMQHKQLELQEKVQEATAAESGQPPLALPEFNLDDYLRDAVSSLGTSDPLDEADLGDLQNRPATVQTAANAKQLHLPIYHYADLPEDALDNESLCQGSFDEELKKRITCVLEQEAPISRKQLQIRIVKSVGLKKVGPRLAKHLDEIFAAQKLPVTSQTDGQEFLWQTGQSPSEYRDFRVNGAADDNKRAPEDISEIEIANAVVHVLTEQLSLPDDDLRTEVRTVMGFGRLTPKINALLSNAILYAAEQGRIKQDSLGNWVLE